MSPSSAANTGQSSEERDASSVNAFVSGSGARTPAAARVAPAPGSPRSSTQTRSPRSSARQAVARPMIPPPTIAASYRSISRTIGSAAVHRRAKLARSRLYLVLEALPHGRDPSPLLDAALTGGVDIVQLRDKDLPDDELVRAAEPFRRLCNAHGALFVLNDRPDLVERCGADGVHVGRGDAPLADARRAAGGEAIVGLSATTAAELRGDP